MIYSPRLQPRDPSRRLVVYVPRLKPGVITPDFSLGNRRENAPQPLANLKGLPKSLQKPERIAKGGFRREVSRLYYAEISNIAFSALYAGTRMDSSKLISGSS